jgi:SAM-dependent methyltransferase
MTGDAADGLIDALRRAPGAPLLRFLWRLRDPASRRRALFDLAPPQGLFQPEATTAMDRYPAIFRFMRQRLGDGSDIRILSFGCATGEEALTLRRYFPAAAQIRGLDANRFNIAACRRAHRAAGGDPALEFHCAVSAEAEPFAAYDAIFAMAVFRHGALNAGPPGCAHLIRFTDFERCVGALADRLRPGGLLALRHANFRFADAAAARAFTRIFVAEPASAEAAPPIYGRDDRLLPGACGDDGVFEKRRA